MAEPLDKEPFRMHTREEMQRATERDQNAPRPWIKLPVGKVKHDPKD